MLLFGMHEADKFRSAAADGMAMGLGLPVQSPAHGAEDFRGAGLQHIARICLERSGVPSKELVSGDAVARHAIRTINGMSTSDLPNILMDVANKSLLKAYQESPRTFLPLIREVGASDFKTIYGIRLSEGPELDLVHESEEYKAASLSDTQESYAVKKYGRILFITREMIVNDDTRALSRLPQMFGQAAARKESDVIWSLITSNPTMAEDSTALFHADHGNLETNAGNKGTVASDKLSAGRAAMRTQAGMSGSYLNLYPRYLMVPAAQSTDTEVLVRSISKPEANMPGGTFNPWTTLTPIIEPRLDADSTKAWYLAADPSQIDIIEMAYLLGQDEPQIEQQMMFNTDRAGFKVRHEFGAGVMDYRGLFKNPGE